MTTDPHPREHPAAAATTLLRLEGRDALPLLHRITTQSLIDMKPGEVRMTLFCDFRGRLLHRTAVAMTHDTAVWLVRDDAPAEPLVATLDHHIFREDVRIIDLSEARWIRAVDGGVGLPPATVSEHEGVPTMLEVDSTWAIAIEPRSADDIDASDEYRRIRAGRPRHGHEIHADFNPYEVGLAHEVHLDKGCYIGQEALQRLMTYRSVRRQIAWVSGEGEMPKVPRDIQAGAPSLGRLTSATHDQEGWIGLAVLKHEAFEPEVELTIREGGTLRRPRPFPPTHPVGRP